MNKTGHIIVETGFINNLPSTETLCYTMQEDFNSFFGFIADVSDEYAALPWLKEQVNHPVTRGKYKMMAQVLG